MKGLLCYLKGVIVFNWESLMDFEIRNWWHVTYVTGIYLWAWHEVHSVTCLWNKVLQCRMCACLWDIVSQFSLTSVHGCHKLKLIKLINNSSSLNKGNHDRESDLISIDLTILFLRFFLRLSFDWEDASNAKDRDWLHFQTPQSSSKILCCSSYFQLSSRCLGMWSKTVFRVCYITSKSNQESGKTTVK